jgi:hypothetical protein
VCFPPLPVQAISLSSPLVSLCRLRALRAACLGAGADPEALLFVVGPDGKSNSGSTALLQYLVLGQSGRVLAGAAGGGSVSLASSSLPEALEDSVLVVARDHVRVYYSGEAVEALARLVAAWGPAVEWVLPSADMEDMERAERFKVCLGARGGRGGRGGRRGVRATAWRTVAVVEPAVPLFLKNMQWG